MVRVVGTLGTRLRAAGADRIWARGLRKERPVLISVLRHVGEKLWQAEASEQWVTHPGGQNQRLSPNPAHILLLCFFFGRAAHRRTTSLGPHSLQSRSRSTSLGPHSLHDAPRHRPFHCVTSSNAACSTSCSAPARFKRRKDIATKSWYPTLREGSWSVVVA